MKKMKIDIKSMVIGALFTALVFTLLGSGGAFFNNDEVLRLKMLAGYIQQNGDLNMGNHKIIMLGSSIYDNGSEGGGLIIKGGADRIHFHGGTIFYDNPYFTRPTIKISANLDMGKNKIIMQGSSIYDDSSEGGGLILKGGANKIHLHAMPIFYDQFAFNYKTLNLGVNLNLGKNKIIMQGSSVYDDSSEGGGLILKGGAGKVHVHGHTIFYDNPYFNQATLDLNTNLNMGKNRIIMQGSSIYDDSSEGGGLILKGGAGKIHVFGRTIQH